MSAVVDRSVCRVCGGRKEQRARLCGVCSADAARRRPWTAGEVARLMLAAREMCDVFRPHADYAPESELQRWRETIDALDRRKPGAADDD